MKLSQIIFLGAGLWTMSSCSPTEYRVERSTVIDAPPELVFEQVNTMANREGWSPWEHMDPNMIKTFKGPASGVGATYKWSGNDSVGTGVLKIIESEPPTHIRSELTFAEPFESRSIIEWSFEGVAEGTRATWAISGELPGYLFWMDQSDMEESMAPDFERGLADLKEVSERLAAASHSPDDLVAQIKEVDARPYYYIQDEVQFQDLDGDFFSSRFGEIMAYLGPDTQNMLSAPFASFPRWDEDSQMAEVSVSVACRSNKPGEGNIKKGETYSGKTLMCVYKGPYENTSTAHDFLHRYADEHKFELVGIPWEVYITDPGLEPDSTQWITEVYYPVAGSAVK